MDQKELLSVGIIGCGRIGSLWDENIPAEQLMLTPPKTHALAYFQNRNVKIAGICDSDSERVSIAARKWNVNFATNNLEDFLKQKFDIISICTPPQSRKVLLTALIKHSPQSTLLIEKPFAENLAEAKAVKELTDQLKRKPLLNYSRRFTPGIQVLKKQIAIGEWGSLQSGTAYYGNGYMNNGSHMIDLICYLLGTPESSTPLTVTADDRTQQELTLSSLLKFKTGALLQIHGLDHRHFTLFELDLVFSKGRVRLTDRCMTIQKQKIIDDPVYEGFKILGTPSVESTQYELSLQNAVAETVALHRNQNLNPSCSVDDALNITSIIDQTLRSQTK
ncbi:MAG: Gfo/Idh/MocA family protein [Pseudobdellovibrio sp.]